MDRDQSAGGSIGASRRYDSPLDVPSKALTTAVLVTMFAGICLFGFMPRINQVFTGLFLAFSIVVVTTAYTFRPTAYGMNKDSLIVYFRWRTLHIPWNSVRWVELEPTTKSFRSIRVFGSGGILGYLGRYWSPALGFHIRLVTDRNRVIVVHRKIPYCVSPDDPDRFVREASSYIKSDAPPTDRPRMRRAD